MEESVVYIVIAAVQIGGGQNFQRASIAMPQKQKMPKIEQRIIVSG